MAFKNPFSKKEHYTTRDGYQTPHSDEASRFSGAVGEVRDRINASPFAKRAVIGGVAVATLFAGFYHSVDRNEVGARINKFTGGCDELTTGTYFFPRIVTDWYVLSTKVESTDLSAGKEGDRPYDDRLSFKTRDGNEIKLSLNMPYQVNARNACAIISNVGTSNEEIREKIVRPVVHSVPRDHFGALDSTQFGNTNERMRRAEMGSKDLGSILVKYGLLASPINMRDFEFANPEYRNLVAEMKLAESELPAVIAGIPAQEEENKRMYNEADKERQDKMAQADGELNQVKVAADGYFKEKKNAAGGILAQGRNRAETIRKERESMISSGGATKVRMALADAFKGKKIVQVPHCENGGQLNIMDLNKFMTQYSTAKAVQDEK